MKVGEIWNLKSHYALNNTYPDYCDVPSGTFCYHVEVEIINMAGDIIFFSPTSNNRTMTDMTRKEFLDKYYKSHQENS